MLRKSNPSKEMVWLVLSLDGDVGGHVEKGSWFFETETEARAFADAQDTEAQGALTVFVARVYAQTDTGEG